MGKTRLEKAAALLGRKGGQAGTGASKVRGDSDYYRRIRRGAKGANLGSIGTKCARARGVPEPWLSIFVLHQMETTGCSRDEAEERAVVKWREGQKP